MASSKNSEDVLVNTIDSCLADTVIKIGGGLLTGTLFSFLLFKRKSWPLVFGVGVGAGMGISNCRYKLNVPHLIVADIVKVEDPSASSFSSVKPALKNSSSDLLF